MKLGVASLILSSLAYGAKAFSTGSPVCTADEAAPEHNGSAGTLADFGLTITVGGTPLALGTSPELTVGTAVEVVISGSPWRGIMVRVPGGTIEIPDGGLYQEVGNCDDGVSTGLEVQHYYWIVITASFKSHMISHPWIPQQRTQTNTGW